MCGAYSRLVLGLLLYLMCTSTWTTVHAFATPSSASSMAFSILRVRQPSRARHHRNGFAFAVRATSSSALKKEKSANSSSHRNGSSSSSSSSSSKKTTSTSKLPRNSVVRRLKRAAEQVVATQRETEKAAREENKKSLANQPQQRDSTSLLTESAPHVPTLLQLTQVIDQRLQQQATENSLSSNSLQRKPHSSRIGSVLPPDSIGAIYGHNHLHPRPPSVDLDGQGDTTTSSSTPKSADSSASTSATSPSATSVTTRHVAILLAKPLQDDQITVEGAARVRMLVSSMMPPAQPSPEQTGETTTATTTRDVYQPHLIVFVGAITGDNRVADADAAYIYFRHLWSSCTCSQTTNSTSTVTFSSSAWQNQQQNQNQQLRRPQIHIERNQLDQGGLQQVAQLIQQTFIPAWWDEILLADNNRASKSAISSTATTTSAAIKRKQKLQVHFSIISSEYQLCQLNDIHTRSPNQSALRAFRSLSRTTSISPHLQHTTLQVEPSWSFHGMSTPTQHPSYHPLRAFCSKTYKTAQSMVPVLYNLRGVVNNREFFQRDNYRALVAARRSLIHDVERMYHRHPSLQAVLSYSYPYTTTASSTGANSIGSSLSSSQQPTRFSYSATTATTTAATATSWSSSSSSATGAVINGARNGNISPSGMISGGSSSNSNIKSLDVVLESALLSLGRCLDLVRPAGMLTGSVPLEDFKRALSSLQQAYYLLDRACDPDEPLPPEEWGKMY